MYNCCLLSIVDLLLNSLITVPWVLICQLPALLKPSPSFLLSPFFCFFWFYFICSPVSSYHHTCVCVCFKYSPSARVCLCGCVRPSHPRNPSSSHLWRSQQARKQAPPPAASQQPMGGLVWDYLGTWVAGGPVNWKRRLHDRTHCADEMMGYESRLWKRALPCGKTFYVLYYIWYIIWWFGLVLNPQRPLASMMWAVIYSSYT